MVSKSRWRATFVEKPPCDKSIPVFVVLDRWSGTDRSCQDFDHSISALSRLSVSYISDMLGVQSLTKPPRSD